LADEYINHPLFGRIRTDAVIMGDGEFLFDYFRGEDISKYKRSDYLKTGAEEKNVGLEITKPTGHNTATRQAETYSINKEEISLKEFREILSKTSRNIKVVLMDQTKMGGVGNIYANDALYLAGIRPDRKAKSLDSTEIERLYKAVKEVINRGIKYGGASAANYVDTRGLGGTYQEHFLVYKQEGKTCDRCGGKIKKIKMGGRGTFYCPGCQK
jgi:DNA-formamidopyrimidine glycosylase